MAKTKLKPLSKKEHAELWMNVESEGFGYYMLSYGPDINAIVRLGFDREELNKAIAILSKVQSEIAKGEQYLDELEE